MNHESVLNQVKRWTRDRERELKGELELSFDKPKKALVAGTQLKEVQLFQRVIQEIVMMD